MTQVLSTQILWLLKETVIEMSYPDATDSYMASVKHFITIAVTMPDIYKKLFFSCHIDENRKLIEKYVYICNEAISYCKKKNYSVDYKVLYKELESMSKWLHYSRTLFWLMKWLKVRN